MEIHRVGKIVHTLGISTIRYGLAINLLEIGRVKFDDYEVENIASPRNLQPPARVVCRRIGGEEGC